MAAAAADDDDDRFSDVPDELLVHVISFLPVRDAARTAVLSRRWRPLWLRTGTINIDSSSSSYRKPFLSPEIIGKRLFRAALAAAGRQPVRRVSLFVNGDSDRLTKDTSLRYILMLLPAFLPGQNLRVLDLALCRLDLPPPQNEAGASFPRLASLRLVRCSIANHHMEALTRAAPSLAVLHVECLDCYCYPDNGGDRLLLHCPNLTDLTLADPKSSSIDVYAPRLRNFRYSGAFVEFVTKSEATNLRQVSLNFHHYTGQDRRFSGLLWQFLGSLQSMKALKLRLLNMKDLVVQHERLPLLHNLEHLELEAELDPDCREDPAEAIATLLGHCPVIRHLQLQFSRSCWYRGSHETMVRPDFDVSVDLFNKRESKEIALMLNRDGEDEPSIIDFPELTGCRFSCLQSHLKYVKLQFKLGKPNSFEVSLAKFLAENCKVLEVLQVEDGDQNFLSHINRKVDRWRLNALKRSDCT
ncbi:hypothetical protein BAE44_0010440 [Dichanthelium oligosanthes]|uniref:F-box domain-containing protein n=1 Tax=Dichanthelium oligosanthes TaxID=888268 RepID=A0A1E5VTX0_9POAL|nr:hypothetical protein BAE44_0010440 [Dichanthelium oligosanthes]